MDDPEEYHRVGKVSNSHGIGKSSQLIVRAIVEWWNLRNENVYARSGKGDIALILSSSNACCNNRKLSVYDKYHMLAEHMKEPPKRTLLLIEPPSFELKLSLPDRRHHCFGHHIKIAMPGGSADLWAKSRR